MGIAPLSSFAFTPSRTPSSATGGGMLAFDSLSVYKSQIYILTGLFQFGAGDGNRTHATSLEGWGSTVELHPRIPVRKTGF